MQDPAKPPVADTNSTSGLRLDARLESRLDLRRFASIDVARGLIMIVMAVDHCASGWSAHHGALRGVGTGEISLPAGSPLAYYSLAEQITRQMTHICAPGFQLLAGLGLAISVYRRQQAGANELLTSLDMAFRGIVLIACDWVLMYYAFGKSAFLFLVLCCIGSSTILFSVLRFLPRAAILAFGVLVLLHEPLYCPTAIKTSSAENYFGFVWTSVAFGEDGAWNIMYPIFPWVGFFAIGWFFGCLYAEGERPSMASMFWLAAICFVDGVLFRRYGGLMAERVPGGELGITNPNFWLMAKYPPSPFFALITLSSLFALLGALQPLDRSDKLSTPWVIPQVFGRVALFFFVVHFYFYGITAMLMKPKGGLELPAMYAVWATGLVLLWPVCWGYDKLRNRHRTVLRYF